MRLECHLLCTIIWCFLLVETSAQDGCLSYTIENKCCANEFIVDGKSHSACIQDIANSGNYARHCKVQGDTMVKCMQNKLPGIGHAYPLGMSNGAILSEQILVPSNTAERGNLRFFDDAGWKPKAEFFEQVRSNSISFDSFGTRVPKAVLRDSKIFIQIDFIRPKKIIYLVIKDHNVASDAEKNTDRWFGLSYRNMDGSVVAYGKDKTYAEALACKGMFGIKYYDCRLKVTPFRARSLRLVPFANQTNYQDSISVEVGGHDYMEADHFWVFDTLKKSSSSSSYISDERGNLSLKSDVTKSEEIYRGTDVGRFNDAEKVETEPLPIDDCLSNLAFCSDGLSIAFALRADAGTREIVSSGTQSACNNALENNCFRICRKNDALKVDFDLNKRVYSVSGTVDAASWSYYVVTWSSSKGITIYKNGINETSSPQTTLTDNYFRKNSHSLKFGAYGDSWIKIQNVKIWKFVLSDKQVKELFSPVEEPVRTFIIKHYGGLCLSLHQSSGRLRLNTACTEKFSLTASKNLKHMATGKCVTPNSLANGAQITLTSDCSNDWTQFEQTSGLSMKHVKSGSCIHPIGGSANPGTNSDISLHSGCNQNRLQFKFIWGAETINLRDLAIKAFRPKSCNEAFEAYGRISNTYELYPTQASSPFLIYCEAKADGGTSFSVPSRRLPILVSGPLPSSPYEIPIGYGPASVMIKSAAHCEQVVTYICNKTAGGVVIVYRNTSTSTSSPVKGTCQSSCSCKDAGSAVKTENETFNDLGVLPISKITVGQMTTLEQKIQIKVSDVACTEELVRTFSIKHSGGLCISLRQSNDRLWLNTACTEKFSLTSNKNLRHMATGKCVTPNSLANNAKITLTSDCSNDWTQFEQTSGFSLKHVQSGKCIHPFGGTANPENEIVIHDGCDATRLEFKFIWDPVTTCSAGFCSEPAVSLGELSKCIFPFMYNGVKYHECTTANSTVPWCSLEATYQSQWEYCVSRLPKAHIDFSITSSDDLGNWKVGNNCNGASNSGPCSDVSSMAQPYVKFSGVNHNIYRAIQSSYGHLKDGACSSDSFLASANSLSAIVFDLEDPSRPNTLLKAVYHINASTSSSGSFIANIYAALPSDETDYITNCRFRYYRSGIYFGPIEWKTSSWVTATQHELPDLKDIVLPVLTSSDVNTSKKLLLVFEWKVAIKDTDLTGEPDRFLDLHYEEKSPANYLYADSVDMKFPGMPLVYNTRYFPPKCQCLRFWYYMSGVNNKVLAVNLHQQPNVHKQLLRIRGDQGSKWKKAAVNFNSTLSEAAKPFYVSFVSYGGSGISKSIAIDDISFLPDPCSADAPALSEEHADNLPTPTIFLALDVEFKEDIATATTAAQPAVIHQLDKYGYPLKAAYFEPGNHTVLDYTNNIEVSGDFTFCFQFKQKTLTASLLFDMSDPKDSMQVSLLSSGEISLKFLSSNGSSYEIKSSPILSIDTWKYICFMHSYLIGISRVYIDSVLVTEKDSAFVNPKINAKKLQIGGGSLACIQLYNTSLDENLIQVLDVCRNRHVKNACNKTCQRDSVCDQLTGKCVCPSYANRFVTDDCSSAISNAVYNESVENSDFNDRKHLKGITFPSLAMAVKRYKENTQVYGMQKFVYVPGPVNSAICYLTTFSMDFDAISCFSSNCTAGSTLSIWILVPPILDWAATGNVTLVKYGKLEILYGVVNDMRNGTTKPIPSLMFSVAQNGNKCIWVSMVYGSKITNSWGHIALTLDSAGSVKVFFNGKQSIVKMESPCPSSAEPVQPSKFVSSSLPFACFDEFTVWNKLLSNYDIERLYNATVFGGQQAVRNSIAFKKLTLAEPEELWGIDQAGTTYKYSVGEWIPLPGERIREIHAGRSGVIITSLNNSLYRREGISTSKPQGETWNMIPMDTAFWGAVEDLRTQEDGVIIARSGYKWHCLSDGMLQKLLDTADALLDKMSMLACSMRNAEDAGYCWSGSSELTAWKKNGPCRNTIHTTNPKNLLSSPLSHGAAFGRYLKYPFAINKNTSTFVEWDYEGDQIEANGSLQYEKFNSVAAVNGMPYGIRSDGDIVQIHQNEPFLIRSLPDGKCFNKGSSSSKLNSWTLSCTELFYFDSQNCLVHSQTRQRVFKESVGSNTLQTNNEGCITLSHSIDAKLHTGDKCLAVDGGVLKEFECSSGGEKEFILERVNPIKMIPSHYLSKKELSVGNADVRIGLDVILRLLKQKWVSQLSNPIRYEVIFLCKKITNELKQRYAGNINYRGSDCSHFTKGNCSSLYCELNSTIQLRFGHFGEGERIILSKLEGRWSDCQGLMCHLSFSSKHVGVSLKHLTAIVQSVQSKSITIKASPHLTSSAAIRGYNVTFVGEGLHKPFAYTIFIQLMYTNSDLIQVNILPAFNYTATITPHYLQGVGIPIYLNFSSLEYYPEQAPGITVVEKGRDFYRLRIQPISNVFWNGRPVGYRIYYQSLLKLKSPVNLTNAQQIRQTHQHMNFTNFNQSKVAIDGLEVYTNYSLIICAYNSYGEGPVTQIFERTNEGEPEVPPPGFNIELTSDNKIRSSWDAITTDIELINGLQLSGYVIMIAEHSVPSLDFAAQRQYDLNTTARSQIFESLQEGREYNVSVAGKVGGRAGVLATLCIRTRETVPETIPKSIAVVNITSSVITITTGDSEFSKENGIILYYNVSAVVVATGFTKYYTVNIMENPCMDQNLNCSGSSTCHYVARSSLVSKREQLETVHSCVGNYSIMPKSALEISFPVNNLLYWTNYSIQSALCNSKGCGPFGSSVLVRTDEHSPTCSPNVTLIQNASSTSMSIDWIRTPISCTHGVLLHFNVFLSLMSELTGNECFNDTSCWPLYAPVEAQTKFYTTNKTEMNVIFPGLKKYRKYCVFLQSVNIKGRGPASQPYCAYTAEDIPEGPPAKVEAKTNTATSLEVKIHLPSDEIVNGIIRGYNVTYYEASPGKSAAGVKKSVVFDRVLHENITTGVIDGLEEYTWHGINVAAFTSIGLSVYQSETVYARTDEAAPSDAIRKLNVSEIWSKNATLSFQQPEDLHINGILKGFLVNVTENRRDGTTKRYSCYNLVSNLVKNNTAVNGTVSINGTATLNETVIGNGTNGTSSNRVDVFFASSQCFVAGANANESTHLFDYKSEHYTISFYGLLPYTIYDMYISACTKIGCGPSANATFRSQEYIPIAAPKLHDAATAVESFSLTISWYTLDVMDQQGIISQYKIKYMKLCEYLRLNNMEISAGDECGRVPPNNTKDFDELVVSGNLTSCTLKSLTPFVKYRCEVCAGTVKGFGPCGSMNYKTDEFVASDGPFMHRYIPTYGSRFKMFWHDIALPSQHGIITGYVILYQLTSLVANSSAENVFFHNKTVKQVNSLEISNLGLKSNYTVKIAGITSKGIGAFSGPFYAETGDYRHGSWSLWSQWSFCTESCGGGISTRRRRCDSPAPFNGGHDCSGTNNQTKTCNEEICSGFYLGAPGENCNTICNRTTYFCNPELKMDGTVKDFIKQGLTCSDASKAKYSQPYHPSYLDESCEGYQNLPTYINCSVKPANKRVQRLCECVSPGDCGCEEWAPWSICSVQNCGGGTKSRTRVCAPKPWCESAATKQSVECNTDPCPVNGNWGAWSEISACNKSCGYGYRHRYRYCDNPPPLFGGTPCPGTGLDVIPECNIHVCPVHGNWGAWGEWRQCNQPCGTGLQIRRRYCDKPAPKYGGNYCFGDDTESKSCNTNYCEGVEILCNVKLTEILWTYEYVYPQRGITQDLVALCQKNVRALYNNSDIIKSVIVNNFREGSVIVNFTVFYAEVKQGEILYLQDYIATTGKMYNLSTIVQDISPVRVIAHPPNNITVVSKSPFTASVSWIPSDDVEQIVNKSAYYVFFRQYDTSPGEWELAGVPDIHSTNFTVVDLKANTKYRFRMTLAVRSGNGPASPEVVAATKEGVPSVAPTELSLLSSEASVIYVQWKAIPDNKFHGRKLGYRVKYKKYFDTSFSIENVPYGMTSISINNLKAFTLYVFEVEAYTGAGNGPPVSSNMKTPEGAPSVSPGSFKVRQGYSISKLHVSWGAISDDAANGILLGYKLKYTITHVSGQPVVGAQTTKEFVLDKFTFSHEFTGLQSYTTYSISVNGYTGGGEGPDTTPISATTCKCPNLIFLNWFSSPPYVVNSPGSQMTGIMALLVKGMIKASCGKCNNQEPNVYAYQSLSGENPVKDNALAVKKSIGNEFHVSFPIFGYSTITRYMEKHIFILFVESAGSATVVRNEVDYAAKTINAFKSIGNIWPMYLITVLITAVCGIIIWAAEKSGNEEFAEGHYITGAFQGFWWAFISMTTVGYGDITPRTIRGRIVAIAWTLAGLVLSGILLGSLTSSVTSLTLPPEVKLYGTKSAAINNSFEYNLGVRRNSIVNSQRQYQSTEEVLTALKNQEVDISLLDAFTAIEMQDVISAKSLKVKEVIKANTGYGVVLSNELVRLESDFRSYIASNQGLISSFTANMTSKLNIPNTATEVPMLFDPSTALFRKMLEVEGILLAVCTALGILYSTFKTVRKRKSKIMSSSELLLHEMRSFDGSVEEFESTVQERVDSLALKHSRELAELLRLRKSYKRMVKRNNPIRNGRKKSKWHKLKGGNIGFSDI